MHQLIISKKTVLSILLAIMFSSFAFAQEPVLSVGDNPVVLSFQDASGSGSLPTADAIPQSQLITPEQLNQRLKTAGHKPLVLAIGPRSMYAQAHLPGSEYMGAGSSDAGQQKIKDRVKSLPKNSAIVLYCGCCPWSHCPNVHPAYQLLHSLGYTNVKVVYIANDFGTDWVNRGYPIAKGE